MKNFLIILAIFCISPFLRAQNISTTSKNLLAASILASCDRSNIKNPYNFVFLKKDMECYKKGLKELSIENKKPTEIAFSICENQAGSLRRFNCLEEFAIESQDPTLQNMVTKCYKQIDDSRWSVDDRFEPVYNCMLAEKNISNVSK